MSLCIDQAGGGLFNFNFRPTDRNEVPTSTLFLNNTRNFFVNSVMAVYEVVDDIMQQPNIKGAIGTLEITSGLLEMAAGGALTYGTGGMGILYSGALWMKGNDDVYSGLAKLRSAFGEDIPDEISMLDDIIGEENSALVGIADNFYSTYDILDNINKMDLRAIGENLISALKLFVKTVEEILNR